MKRKLGEEKKLECQLRIEEMILEAEKAENRRDYENAANYYGMAAEISIELKDKKSVIMYSKKAESILKEQYRKMH